METETLLSQIHTVVSPLVAEQSVELVDTALRREGRRWVLRFLVDTPQGITLDRCAALNRQIGAAIETANLFDDPYLLEVCSPGLDRPFTSLRDFERALGDQIEVISQTAEGRTVTQTGRLMHVDEQVLLLEVRAGERVSVPRERVKISRRVITF